MKLLIVVLIAFLGLAKAEWDDGPEIDSILNELDNTELEEVDVEWEKLEGVQRGIFDILSKVKDKWVCEGKECIACATGKFWKMELGGCMKVIMIPEEMAVLVQAMFARDAAPFIQQKLNLKRFETACTNLPKLLSNFKVCIYNRVEETDENGITMCTSANISYQDRILGELTCACMQYKDGQFGFDLEHPQSDTKGSLLTVRLKNPFQSLISLFKSKA